MEFYLNLPSDACTDIIPENTASSYVTILPQNIQLTGNYEVALTELSYKTSWANFTPNKKETHLRILLPVKSFVNQVDISDVSKIVEMNSFNQIVQWTKELLDQYGDDNLKKELGTWYELKDVNFENFGSNFNFLLGVYRVISDVAENRGLKKLGSDKVKLLEKAILKYNETLTENTPLKIRPEFTEICSQLAVAVDLVCEYPDTLWRGKTLTPLNNIALDVTDGIKIAINVNFKSGYFSTIKELVDHLNKAIYNNGIVTNLQDLIKFHYHEYSERIFILASESVNYTILDKNFANVIKLHPTLIYSGIHWNTIPISFYEDFKLMYLYSDVVDYSIVGNANAQLLRSFPSNNDNSGKYVVENFYNPYYIPVKVNSFSTIELKILNEYGEPFLFKKSKTNVVLHFRQSSSLG